MANPNAPIPGLPVVERVYSDIPAYALPDPSVSAYTAQRLAIMEAHRSGKSSSIGDAYLKLPGVTVFDASTNPAMVKSGGGGGVGTQTASSLNWWPGSTAVKLTCTAGSGGSITWTRTATIFAAATFKSAPSLRIPVYFEDWSSINGLTVNFSFGDATFTNRAAATWSIGPGGAGRVKRSGWQILDLSFSGTSWAITGTVDWTQQCFGLNFFFTIQSGSSSTAIHVDDIVLGQKAKAKVIPVFDYGYLEQFTMARPVLNSLGIKATFAITPGALGTNGCMTVDQVKQLVAEGHTLAFRPAIGFGSNSVQTCIDAAAAAQAYLRSNFGAAGEAGCRHIVYNQGQYWPGSGGVTNAIGDVTVVNRLRDELGVLTGRTTETTSYPDSMALGATGAPAGASYGESRIPNLLTHGIIGFYGGNTLASLKGRVDEAVIDGRAVVLFDHTWAYGGADATDPDSRRQFWEYVALLRSQGLVDPMTYQDFYAGL